MSNSEKFSELFDDDNDFNIGRCVQVQSIDHITGTVGKYFNFNVSDVETYLGENLTFQSTATIDQYRDGVRIAEAQGIVMWNNANGGAVGDGHGRYNTATLPPSAGQWKIGDFFCFPPGIADSLTYDVKFHKIYQSLQANAYYVPFYIFS